MLGTLRFILAIAVALSHFGWRVGGLNPGVVAVVGFYLISGYVVTGLLRRHYASGEQVVRFYQDRAIRILPHYWLLAALAACVWWWLQPESFFLARAPGSKDWLNNVAVVPLNYFMFNKSDRFTLIPPAWSLGVELQFYLLVPFLLRLQARKWALPASLAVALLAALGVVNTDWYGYRLLPGVLFIFLLGSCLYDWHQQPGTRNRLVLPLGMLAVAAAALTSQHRLFIPYTAEIALGIGLGLPAIHALARRASRKWDDLLGHLSYGVFLNHFIILWLIPATPSEPLAALRFVLLSILLACASYTLLERPMQAWRRQRRLNNGINHGKGISSPMDVTQT